MKAGGGVSDEALRDDVLLEAIRGALERSRRRFVRNPNCNAAGVLRLADTREREVMTLVVSGLFNKQVAASLVSVRSP